MQQDRTPYQEKIIKRYYNNRDDLMLQKLGEMTTDLYLAEGKRRERLWSRVAAALTNLGVESARIEKIVAADNPSLVAELLTHELKIRQKKS